VVGSGRDLRERGRWRFVEYQALGLEQDEHLLIGRDDAFDGLGGDRMAGRGRGLDLLRGDVDDVHDAIDDDAEFLSAGRAAQ